MRVLLVDDHKIMRDGLRALLENLRGVTIVGDTGDGISVMKMTAELKPDLVLMGVALPGLNGIDATCRLKDDFPNVKVIALSMYSDMRIVKRMLMGGAMGYILKESAFEDVKDAIKAVTEGRIYISPKIADLVARDYITLLNKPSSEAKSVLSKREREVLQLVAEGKNSHEIATILHISVTTVNTHRKHIMDKLKIRSTAELTKYAILEGLTFLGSVSFSV